MEISIKKLCKNLEAILSIDKGVKVTYFNGQKPSGYYVPHIVTTKMALSGAADKVEMAWYSEIFIDEAAVYFDSRLLETIPKEIRRFLFTHRHLGTNLYMIAQDFNTIDNSFRRLTEHLFYVRKLISTREPSPLRKPLKRPFSACTIHSVAKTHWHLEKEHYLFESTQVELFFKKHFDIFDTRQELPTQPLPPLRKQVRICPEDGYKQVRYI